MVAVILRGWDYRIYGCSTVRHLLAVAIGQNEIENAFRNPEKKGNVFRHLPASFLPTPSSCTPPSTTTSSTSHLKERDFCRILATRRTRITRSSRKSFKKLSSPGKHLQGLSPKAISVWVYGKHWSLGDFHKDQCLSYPAKDQVPCLSLSLIIIEMNRLTSKILMTSRTCKRKLLLEL